jgi:hypothetical protein
MMDFLFPGGNEMSRIKSVVPKEDYRLEVGGYEMKTKRIILSYFITFILFFSLIGCSNPDKPLSQISSGSETSNSEISNRNEVLNVGKIFSTTLDENLSTGYIWHYSIAAYLPGLERVRHLYRQC